MVCGPASDTEFYRVLRRGFLGESNFHPSNLWLERILQAPISFGHLAAALGFSTAASLWRIFRAVESEEQEPQLVLLSGSAIFSEREINFVNEGTFLLSRRIEAEVTGKNLDRASDLLNSSLVCQIDPRDAPPMRSLVHGLLNFGPESLAHLAQSLLPVRYDPALTLAIPGITWVEGGDPIGVDLSGFHLKTASFGAPFVWPKTLSKQFYYEDVNPEKTPELFAILDNVPGVLIGSNAVNQEPFPLGIRLDEPMRLLLRSEIKSALSSSDSADLTVPPDPYTDPSSFIHWLQSGSDGMERTKGRYWSLIWHLRDDLRTHFPEPESRSSGAFSEWCSGRFVAEGVQPWLTKRRRLSQETGNGSTSELVVNSDPIPVERDCLGRAYASCLEPAMDLVGYFEFRSSLGDVARILLQEISGQFRHAMGVRAVSFRSSPSPMVEYEGELTASRSGLPALIVANADQVPALMADGLFDPGVVNARQVAYWFWELSSPSPSMRSWASKFDEIWVATRFVYDAVVDAGGKARLVPLPLDFGPRPAVAKRDRNVTTFLIVFDFLSVPERKNPEAGLKAYLMAFPVPRDGVKLIVKSLGGDKFPHYFHYLKWLGRHRSDIEFRDAALSEKEMRDLYWTSDCLISLHRSEGLGLHCAEMLWSEGASIMTNYSGPIDFVSSDYPLLVDFELVEIGEGVGPYPGDAYWAEPNLEQAAELVRKFAEDPSFRDECLSHGASLERYNTNARQILAKSVESLRS